MSKQLDMICLECPLTTGCDEQSVFCALRWATDLNEAQRRLVAGVSTDESRIKRQAHDANMYERNRVRKIMAAKARHRAKRGLTGPPSPPREFDTSVPVVDKLQERLREYRANG